MAEVRPGDALEAVVERVVPGGAGLARTEGVVTLVAGALPGDRVRLRVEDASARLIRGRAEEILEAGEARRAGRRRVPPRAERRLRRLRLARGAAGAPSRAQDRRSSSTRCAASAD